MNRIFPGPHHLLLLFFSFLAAAEVMAQQNTDSGAEHFSSSSVFSHNDYLQQVPFYLAYLQKVGFVEADIFLRGKDLVVAHTQEEIVPGRTLDVLYLQPLQAVIARNKGHVFDDSTRVLTLMIDIKSEADATLSLLVRKLGGYPQLTACPTLRIVVSGNMPPSGLWERYPAYIYFDGRPQIPYTAGQLERVALISDSFTRYSAWNGNGKMTDSDAGKLAAVRDEVHAKGKQIRLWAAPDNRHAWMTLMKLNIDIVNTDHVQDAVTFVTHFYKRNYQVAASYPAYRPVSTFTAAAVPKNVILLIGDGTGLAQMYAGYTANRGALNIFSMGTVGLSVTTAADSYITDSAAGATAFSTGRKTNNRYIGVDSVGTRLTSIVEILEEKGFHTTIVSSGDITDATPASFYAHQVDRGMREAIARDFVSSDVDVLIGGDRKAFMQRSDNANLFTELRRKGYSVSDNLSSLDTISRTRFVVIDDAAGLRKSDGRGDFLTRAFRKSVDASVKNGAPFFMMLEGAQVDWGGHNNDLPYLTTELLDFDALVGEAVRFADANKETLVIVTADHETGGLSLTGGDIAKGSVSASFSTGSHTAIPVPVFAFGPGASSFTGVYSNTEVYHKIVRLLGMEKAERR